MKPLYNIISIGLFLALALSSCEKKAQINEINSSANFSKYKEYISNVSSGNISAYDDIRVVLQNPVAGWEESKELSNHLLTVTPRVAGKVTVLNSQTVAFVPNEPLDQDTQYIFSLALEEIIPKFPKKLGPFTFAVKTPKLQFNVNTGLLQSYSKDWQYIEGSINSSDILPRKVALDLLKASQEENDKIRIKIEEQIEKSARYTFKIDSINRLAEDTEVALKWDGDTWNIDSRGTNTISIPGKNNFRVVNTRVINADPAYLEINFSDPIAKNQNFSGLVVLNHSTTLQYAVNNNLLKVFPQEEIKGTTFLEVFKTLKSTDNLSLKAAYSQDITFEQLKPQIKLLSSGNIMPSSENLKINFETVNLNAVDVTVIRIYQNNIMQFLQQNPYDGSSNLKMVGRPAARKTIDLAARANGSTSYWRAWAVDISKLVTTEPGAIYRVNLSFSPAYSTYSCSESNFDALQQNEVNYDTETSEDSFWDQWDSYGNYYYGYYDWYERNNPCHTSYYRNKSVGINILASDIGLTVKKGLNDSYFVAATDLMTAAPVPATKVVFYNYQQQELGVVTTNEKGVAYFDADSKAHFVIASYKNQKSYLKLTDGSSLSTSKFDVSGKKLNKGLKGYIYGERGVWRPGDTLFLSFVLQDKNRKLPLGHPVRMRLQDPYGKTVFNEVQSNNSAGIFMFRPVTSTVSPTGNWTAKVNVGGAEFRENIAIETVKPNRLKIKTDFGAKLLKNNTMAQGKLEAIWLHGAVASNLKAEMMLRFSATQTKFKNFPGFVFSDPSRSVVSEDISLFSGSLSNEGKANIDFKLVPQTESPPPGMLRASFFTKVFEKGGDFSTHVTGKNYSPYDTYLGLNVPKGDAARNMLLTDTKHRFEVVSVDPEGKPKAAQNISVRVYKINWRWWWDTSAENLSSYDGSSYKQEVFHEVIHTDSSGKGTFGFELKHPEWGRFFVRIEDQGENGGHAAGKIIYVDWPGWAGKSRKLDPSDATMLTFSTDKNKYFIGETATLSIPGSSTSRALLTIENGNEVLDAFWIDTTEGETKFNLPIKEYFSPNVYLNISLIQPHKNRDNDLPMRLYGVIPITVEDPKTHLQPLIDMPEVLAPQESFEIKIKEKTGKPMTYTLAVVNEGLLDLTNFKTPDPWKEFYAREALGVKSWDLYDEVIGAFGGQLNHIFAIGGGAFKKESAHQKANQFKPMVIFKGPFTLEAGKTDKHQIKLPQYLGSVRTMVVASNTNDAAYGKAEKTSPVKKPLMILPSVPRKVSPGETIKLPVTIFAMDRNVKNVSLQLETNKAFEIVGGNNRQVNFAKPDEKLAWFTLNVNEFGGVGKITLKAKSQNERAAYQTEVDVINPNPVSTKVYSLAIDAGSEKEIHLDAFGVTGSNEAVIEFSSLPPMNVNNRLASLIRYPHGCVEQTTSAAFPQLLLTDIFDLTSQKKKNIQKNITVAINKLTSFQNTTGGLTYWPGQSATNDWGTSYAGHFLLEAEKKGYVVPGAFKDRWIKYQQKAAGQWKAAAGTSDLVQAYRLFTLALSGNANLTAMNRLRESRSLSNEARHRLAATYAQIGQSRAASSVFNQGSMTFTPVRFDNITYGSALRNRAMALETLVALDYKDQAHILAREIAKELNNNNTWMSTQTTAYCLFAMSKYCNFIGGKEVNALYNGAAGAGEVHSKQSMATRNLKIKKGDNLLKVKNNASGILFVNIPVSGILPVGQELQEQRNISVRVRHKNNNGSSINISELKQASGITTEITVINKSRNNLKDMALTHIIPGGWEIINTRYTDIGSGYKNPAAHTDIRDDRVNFYFDLNANQSKTFKIVQNASFEGRYYMPGVQAEAMYENEYFVRTKGQWIEVVK